MPDNKEKFEQLNQVIEELKDQPGALMPVMQRAQSIFGCVSLDVQKAIAEGLGVTLSEVYGTACYVKGSQKVLDRLSEELKIPVGDTTDDGLFTLQATRCLGACGLAPVMTVNDEVYGRLVPDDIPGILAKYKE